MTDAHEQDERFTERDLIAAHAERAESEEFHHNKALLMAQHQGCWFNTDLSEGQCAKLMGTDILGFRIRRDDLLKEGLQLAESLRKGE